MAFVQFLTKENRALAPVQFHQGQMSLSLWYFWNIN